MDSDQGERIQVGDLYFNLLISEAEIQARIKILGAELSSRFIGHEIILVGVLKGAFVFMADLMRNMKGDIRVEFIKASSYRGTQSMGNVALGIEDINLFKDKVILLVEDIIDTGLTITTVIQELRKVNPKTIEVVSLLRKPKAQIHSFPANVCFDIEDRFVVGYGLDYDEMGRELPAIYVLLPNAVKN